MVMQKPGGERDMGIFQTTILAFSMSTDAFAVSVGKGAALRKPRFTEALRTGAIFGAIEGMTPIVGWGIGLAASQHIAAVDHWIAFIILGSIGLKMIYEGLQADSGEEKPVRHSIARLMLTALGTSIDSMAVGVSLSILGTHIGWTAAAIGFATFTMVTIGVMTGQYIGSKYGKIAEMLGGAALIFLGTKTLLEHLGYI
jgi:putative Mn2+ efflux pump MntP